MKWLVALALVIASMSLVVPALMRETPVSDPLEKIHELAAF